MDPLNTCCQPPYHNHHHYLTSSNRVLHSGQVSCLAPTRQDPGELSKLPALSKHRGTLEGICGCLASPKTSAPWWYIIKKIKHITSIIPLTHFSRSPVNYGAGQISQDSHPTRWYPMIQLSFKFRLIYCCLSTACASGRERWRERLSKSEKTRSGESWGCC